jgi:hypothetical protein
MLVHEVVRVGKACHLCPIREKAVFLHGILFFFNSLQVMLKDFLSKYSYIVKSDGEKKGGR